MSDLIGGSADPTPPPGSEGPGVGEPPRRGTGPTSNLRRATVGMAAGTGFSRLTGVLRILALAYALGITRLADAYNLANTTPNMILTI